MEFSITMGWWLLPLAVTVTAFIYAFLEVKRSAKNSSGGYYGGMGESITGLFCYGLSTVISLIAWLIYFIIH